MEAVAELKDERDQLPSRTSCGWYVYDWKQTVELVRLGNGELSKNVIDLLWNFFVSTGRSSCLLKYSEQPNLFPDAINELTGGNVEPDDFKDSINPYACQAYGLIGSILLFLNQRWNYQFIKHSRAEWYSTHTPNSDINKLFCNGFAFEELWVVELGV